MSIEQILDHNKARMTEVYDNLVRLRGREQAEFTRDMAELVVMQITVCQMVNKPLGEVVFKLGFGGITATLMAHICKKLKISPRQFTDDMDMLMNIKNEGMDALMERIFK